MKQGDRVDIRLGEYVVGHGIIETIEDGKAYINIPQTNVIMGVATSLTDIKEEKEVEVHTELAEPDSTPASTESAPETTNLDAETRAILERNPGMRPEDISHEGIPADFDDDV